MASSSASLFPVAFMDAPRVLNTSVTPIPAQSSSTLQVVADIGTRASHAIDWQDSTGDYIGVYIGAIGQETLLTIVGGGVVTRAHCVIAAHSRVSLRSLTSSPITNGYLSMIFLGMGLK